VKAQNESCSRRFTFRLLFGALSSKKQKQINEQKKEKKEKKEGSIGLRELKLELQQGKELLAGLPNLLQ
jgi:hypothetical protein